MTSDSSELNRILEEEEEDTESSDEVQAPTTSSKRSRPGDNSGDQSLRKVDETIYPGLPIESENNSVLNFFSDKAMDKVTEYGQAIFEDILGQREDPQFYAYVNRRLQETGYASTDLTEEFEKNKIPRHQERDFGSLNLKKKKRKAGSITEKGVAETLTGFYKKELGETDNTRTGFFGEEGTIESGTQNFTDIMDVDLISLFSQTIITYLKENKKAITEIQAMVLPDRVFVSANEAAALHDLVGKTLKDVLEVARSYQTTKKGAFKRTKLTKEKIPVVDDERNARAQVIRDLTGVFAGAEASPEMFKYLTTVLVSALYSPEQADTVVAMLETFSADQVFVDATGATTGAALAPFVTGSANAGKLIVIGSGENCHAEQNLLIAIARSGYTGSATIAGGKRPCQTCACAFILVNECKNDNIIWYERPGGAWGGSTKKSFATLANFLEIELEDVTKIAKKLLVDDGQFATSFNPGAPDWEMSKGFGNEVTVKKKAGKETSRADRIPRPKRLPSEIFTGVEEWEPPTLSSQDSSFSLGSQESEIPEDEVAGLQEDREKQDIEKIRADLRVFDDDIVMQEDEGTEVDDTDKEDEDEEQ